MAIPEELIDFEVIENSKENIQSLPGGRSAKALASLLSPMPSGRNAKTPTLDDTRNMNDAVRQEYEIELQSMVDSDDPLDIYDRYVKWTLNAYPSAQATSQSQLLPLLERATKAFLTSSHYKNDPRYLKLWLHYIRLFSDAPRETFAFLARHNIGENLGLFYEEFAAWLENAGRWNQAEEVYKMGIEQEARPTERLMRKYHQFQQRFEARPQNPDEPSSPALPRVRAALAAKIDPFAPTHAEESQASTRQGEAPRTTSRSTKPKMAIFSDADNAEMPTVPNTSKGWDSIGSMKERKKENTMEARPWAGETLKAGGRVGAASKMEIFKDPSLRTNQSSISKSSKSTAHPVNPRTGRAERVFVNIEAVYPNDKEEMSFEELRAASRGWAGRDWKKLAAPLQGISGNARHSPLALETVEPQDIENLTESFQQNASIIDTSTQSMVGMTEPKIQKQKRTKMREVKQEAQTVKTRLESPTGPKMRRKGSSEPTMTFNSRAAHNDIYEMFNQPIQKTAREDTQSGDDTDYGDDTYSTAGESTGTGRISAATSDFGDDTLASVATGENTGSQPESVSPWSDFTASKHVPKPTKSKSKHNHLPGDDMTENLTSSQNLTQTGGIDAGFDTQAIAAIANQDFDDMDTKAIALIAGDVTQGRRAEDGDDDEEEQEGFEEDVRHSEEMETLVEPEPEHIEIQNQPRYVPLPPEDYEPTPLRPYRDPEIVAQNKLPFMTPIVEQTESSIGASTVYKEDYYDSKTPSRTGRNGTKSDSPSKLGLDELLMITPPKESPQSSKRRLSATGVTEEELFTSSPRRKQPPTPETQHQEAKNRDAQAMPPPAQPVFKTPALVSKPQVTTQAPTQGPVIQDVQCNPCDTSIRQQILNTIQPPLSSYDGFTDSSTETLSHHQSLKTFADKLAKQKTSKFSPRKSANDRTLTKAVPPILKFHNTSRVYSVKRELGKGAFAPVHLVDSYDSTSLDSDTPPASPASSMTSSRSNLEALKTESPPHTLVWEFHILRLLRARLAPSSRTLSSLIHAHECHLYRDEAYLILSYSPQGTLLDLVNLVRTEHIRAGKTAVEGVDEPLAVFFGVELLRTMATLHSVGILHGDLKADNCLVRLDDAVDITAPYNHDGKDGWSSKGLTLIDFGRGIDTRMFQPQARFVADWAAHKEDCVEIREARPWKWQIDFFGAASILHTLLFGRYMETIEVRDAENAGDGIRREREMKVKEGFKRYWDREMWSDVFGVLLNRGQCDDEVRERELRRVLVAMEMWLEEEGERKGLKEGVRRCERLVCRKEK